MNNPPVVDKPIDRLSVAEANHLLREEGIPVQDLPKYRSMRFGSNLFFWEHLELLDALHLLTLRDGRLYRKRKSDALASN